MTSMPWDAQGEARAALRAIVADSRYGPTALSNAQTMTNLLKDMLPDAPRESSALIAASEAGLADMLRSNVSHGMDLDTASRLAAGSFENRTALTSDACAWAVAVLASVLRLDAARPTSPPSTGPAGDRHPDRIRHPDQLPVRRIRVLCPEPGSRRADRSRRHPRRAAGTGRRPDRRGQPAGVARPRRGSAKWLTPVSGRKATTW